MRRATYWLLMLAADLCDVAAGRLTRAGQYLDRLHARIGGSP